jgi:hypothetical protein
MNNIRVKQESLNNWREEFSINEEIEGGISVQNVADGLNFTEIETVDIIKPKPIKGSSDIEEGAKSIIRKVIKSPGVKKFVSNLSKNSKVKIVSPNPVITPGSTLGSGGKFAANHFDDISKGAGSSYTPRHAKYLDSKVDKSRRGLTGHAGASGFPTPDSKSVKVYKQPSYANPKYPGDKTGAYARELARQDNTARIGKNSAINKDGTSRGSFYSADGRNTVGGKVKLKTPKGLEDKNLEFLKKMKNESYNNWKLEMVTEMLISEGYNDEEIIAIFEEPQNLMELDRELTAAGIGLAKYGPKAVKFAKGIFNRGVRDVRLTKDILSTAKKLRKPDGISVIKNPKVDIPTKSGGLGKSFKGFMQNVKDAGGNLAKRTKEKLTRISNSKKQEVASTAKDVEALGGAATTPKAPKTKPMKNITPSSIGTKITNATDKIKVAGAAGAGAALGAASTKLSPSKKIPAAPITNDGKKSVDPSKNEKIDKKSGDTGRGKTVDRVYGAQIAQTRKLKGDAAAEKQKKKFMSRPATSLEMEEEVTSEGLLSKAAKIGIGAFALKKGGEFLKKKGDEALDDARKNMKIGGDKRKSDIEKATGVKLEGAYRGGGTTIKSIYDPVTGRPSGFRQTIDRTKEVPLTPSQNRLLVKKKEKRTTVAASYSWRDELGLTERKLTKKEEKKKEDIVMGMKDDKKGFKKRYGDDAKSVMYATATKIAKEKA